MTWKPSVPRQSLDLLSRVKPRIGKSLLLFDYLLKMEPKGKLSQKSPSEASLLRGGHSQIKASNAKASLVVVVGCPPHHLQGGVEFLTLMYKLL